MANYNDISAIITTGKAGSGKDYVLHSLVKDLKREVPGIKIEIDKFANTMKHMINSSLLSRSGSSVNGNLHLSDPLISQALPHYLKLADNEDPHAHYNLGLLYENGIGVPLDLDTALVFYTDAAEISKNSSNSIHTDSLSKIKTIRSKLNENNTMGVTGIKWDADDMNDVRDLSSSMTVTIPSNITDKEEIEEYISDYLSNETGFTHNGFSISNPTENTKSLPEDVFEALKNDGNLKFVVGKDIDNKDVCISIREMLQKLGTDIIRDVSQDFHIAMLARKMLDGDADVFAMGDVRFDNELLFVSSLNSFSTPDEKYNFLNSVAHLDESSLPTGLLIAACPIGTTVFGDSLFAIAEKSDT